MTSEVTRHKMTARDRYAQTFFRAAQDGLLQLYDLEADPGETNNLAQKYRHGLTFCFVPVVILSEW
jgi:hypothetical protein